MDKKLINNIHDKTKTDNFLNFLKDKIGVKGFSFLEELSKIAEVYIFSGVVRNFFIKYNGQIRDFDVVVKTEKDMLSSFLSNLEYKQNSFGGYKLKIGTLSVDLWHVENTWAYKKDKVKSDLFDFYSLPKTAFFNFSSVIFHFNAKEFVYTKNFIDFLKTKTIDLVLEENPMPHLCIVNSIYYHQKFNLTISENLKKYCISHFYDFKEVDFNNIQLKHFKEIKYEYAYIKEYVKIFKGQIMLTENDITQLLAEYLKKNGYKILNQLTTKQKGFDITAESSEGKKLYVEVKGETSANEKSKRYGQYFTGNQIWNHGAVALFTTLRSMNKPEYKDAEFALAFPMNHEPMMGYIKASMDKLGIRVYFVSGNEVRML
ncbi:protein NO VEIN domain-containing protein [Pedobacter borealis]|uniref:protein NO VEIN domain-containing protein n=1 Tax=Pedobacter borealis TaxID=475254 RepID=UPI00068968D7|nr:DUF3883 domain-containing protein [Pedobacter borealis]